MSFYSQKLLSLSRRMRLKTRPVFVSVPPAGQKAQRSSASDKMDRMKIPSNPQQPVRILFVCHGNICRSVMAQWIMQDLVDQAGWTKDFVIDSAALTDDETGHPIYPPARRKLTEKGIPIGLHQARRIVKSDYDRWDHIFYMDDENDWMIHRLFGQDPKHKLSYLCPDSQPIDDPWYTRDFETCYRQLYSGCKYRLDQICSRLHS